MAFRAPLPGPYWWVRSRNTYIASKRSFIGRRRKTTYRITKTGRAALRDYLASMQSLIDAVQIGTADEVS